MIIERDRGRCINKIISARQHSFQCPGHHVYNIERRVVNKLSTGFCADSKATAVEQMSY